jgi:hypothetical protein
MARGGLQFADDIILRAHTNLHLATVSKAISPSQLNSIPKIQGLLRLAGQQL